MSDHPAWFLPPALRARYDALTARGFSHDKILRSLGRHDMTGGKPFNGRRVRARPKSKPHLRWRKLAEAGMTARQAAREMGATTSAAYGAAYRGGWQWASPRRKVAQ